MLFRVLGPVEVEVGGGLLALARRRERCLLGVLLLERGRVSVDRLAELLWEGDPPERARRIIHGHISRVRTVLQADGIGPACQLVTVGAGYRLDAPPEAVDAHRFTAMVDAAYATAEVAERARQLRQALNLWRGPVLDQAASEWLRQRLGAALEEQRLAATETLMADSLALGQAQPVLPELASHAAEHPGRERLIDLYMRALHQVGRKAEALAAFERTRAHLAERLGIDPGAALRERHRAILRDQPDYLATGPAPGARPTSATTTTSATTSATATAPATSMVPRQLPAMVADFVGRAGELSTLDKAPEASAVVIVIIDGMAGVGKPVPGK